MQGSGRERHLEAYVSDGRKASVRRRACDAMRCDEHRVGAHGLQQPWSQLLAGSRSQQQEPSGDVQAMRAVAHAVSTKECDSMRNNV